MGYLSKSLQLLLLSTIGWVLIWIGSTLLGIFWDAYSIINHTISILGSPAAPAQWVMNTIFVIDGLLLIVSAFKLQKVLGRDLHEFGSAHLIALAGIFLMLLAFFPGGAMMGLTVPTQIAHNVIATMLMVSFIFASVVFIWQMKGYDEWKLILKIVGAITVLKILFYSGSVIVMELNGAISQLGGLFQKLGLLMEGVWLILISIKLYQLYPVDTKIAESNGDQ